MKSIVLIAAGFAALLGGCASTPYNAYDDGVDHQKVAAINNVARARGVQVYWHNYPQRKAAPDSIVPTLGEPTGT